MTYLMIQVGTGAIGAWCYRSILPPFVGEGPVEVVATVESSLTGWPVQVQQFPRQALIAEGVAHV
jgi:hypothetical protein